MAIGAGNRAKFEAAREMAFGTITGTFQKIGTSFENQPRVIYIQNFTDTIMDFSVSFTGVEVSFSLSAGGTFTTDVTANGAGTVFTPAIGESVWVKHRTAPSSGFVQFSGVIQV